MKQAIIIMLTAFILASLSTSGFAEDNLEAQALKIANRAVRMQTNKFHNKVIHAKKAGPNFSGRWAGRLVLASSNCTGLKSSFLFRHILSQNTNGVAAIATSHDGLFYAQSRDGGRRLEGGKTVVVSGRAISLALIYKNLASNGLTTLIGFGLAAGNCRAGFGAVGIKQ